MAKINFFGFHCNQKHKTNILGPSSPEGGPSDGESSSQAVQSSSAAGSSQNSTVEVSRINRNQLLTAISLATRDFFDRTNNQPNASTTTASNENNLEQQQQQYSAQLLIMSEMGLMEEAVNLQALILCNGDVEAAINYVMLTTN